MSSRVCLSRGSLALLLLGALALPQFATAQPVRKTAIFVENRAGKQFNDKVPMLEDLITSRISGRGFTVVSRESVVNAINQYPTAEKPSAGVTAGARLDELLSNNSSAVRLAQNMGVDYLLVASLASFGSEKKNFADGDVKTANVTHNLRVSYKVLDAAEGGSLVGDTFKASKTTRATENLQIESSDIVNELLDQVADQVAESLVKKHASITGPFPKSKQIEIAISCGMQDLAQLPLSVADVRVGADGKVAVGKDKLDVQVLDVTVEINGTVVGSAPGAFKVPPGLNKIRLTREGFSPWERTLNATEGQKLKVALQLSEAGYARWKDNTRFLQNLKNGEKLTDAQVKVLEGQAQMLKQSGFKVDLEAKGKSLFEGATFKSIY
jgi:hypothetical protein